MNEKLTAALEAALAALRAEVGGDLELDGRVYEMPTPDGRPRFVVGVRLGCYRPRELRDVIQGGTAFRLRNHLLRGALEIAARLWVEELASELERGEVSREKWKVLERAVSHPLHYVPPLVSAYHALVEGTAPAMLAGNLRKAGDEAFLVEALPLEVLEARLPEEVTPEHPHFPGWLHRAAHHAVWETFRREVLPAHLGEVAP